MELNPNHPVTKQAHDHWHKLCAILMHKFKTDHEVITIADIEEIPDDQVIVIQDLSNGLHLRLMHVSEATKLAKQHNAL